MIFVNASIDILTLLFELCINNVFTMYATFAYATLPWQQNANGTLKSKLQNYKIVTRPFLFINQRKCVKVHKNRNHKNYARRERIIKRE